MLRRDQNQFVLEGPSGTLPIPDGDQATLKFAMLFEGQCEGLGPTKAAKKYGYSKQRYFQLLHRFKDHGIAGLQKQKRGPKTNYRRTGEAICQVIRHRYLDPDASAEVIAQKIRQCEMAISTRSVARIIAEYGLQKKTVRRPT